MSQFVRDYAYWEIGSWHIIASQSHDGVIAVQWVPRYRHEFPEFRLSRETRK